jgi:hypothetical protein
MGVIFLVSWDDIHMEQRLISIFANKRIYGLRYVNCYLPFYIVFFKKKCHTDWEDHSDHKYIRYYFSNGRNNRCIYNSSFRPLHTNTRKKTLSTVVNVGKCFWRLLCFGFWLRTLLQQINTKANKCEHIHSIFLCDRTK